MVQETRLWRFSIVFSVLVNVGLGLLVAMILRQIVAPHFHADQPIPVQVKVVTIHPTRKKPPAPKVPDHATAPPAHPRAPEAEPVPHFVPSPRAAVVQPATLDRPAQGNPSVVHPTRAAGSRVNTWTPHPAAGGGGGGGGGRKTLTAPTSAIGEVPVGSGGFNGRGNTPIPGLGNGTGQGTGTGSGTGTGVGSGNGSGIGDRSGNGPDAPGGGDGPFGIDDSPGPGQGPRHIIYLLDISPSMESRLLTAKQALEKSLSTLRPGEYFDVVRFSDGNVHRFSRDLLPASDQTIASVDGWIDGLQCKTDGGTDLGSALEQVLRIPGVNVVVVLTDGVPTWGRQGDGLITYIRGFNQGHQNARIYTVGLIGRSLDGTNEAGQAANLLQQIARDSGGVYKQVSLGD